jgi:hypothetical protein
MERLFMKMIFTCFIIAGLYSCATSSLHSEIKKQTPEPYRNILTLYMEEPFTLQDFDSVFYTENVRNKFNDLRTMPVRAQMEKTLKRNLSHPFTRVVSSSDVFGVNENIDYTVFKEKLENAKADAILLINEDQYWETHHYNRVGHSVEKDSQPNSAFHCYLVDAATGDIVWLARCTVQGMFAGYENLNNMLARRVTHILKKEGYIR